MISAASNQRREWPAQLAKAQFIWPNQVSKRANATIITGGWLMKCPPPQNPTCSPRPAALIPLDQAYQAGPSPPWRRRGPRASKTAECRVTTSGRTPECRSRDRVCKERGLTLPQIYECELRLRLHDSFSGLCLQPNPPTTSLTGGGELRRAIRQHGPNLSRRQETELGRHPPLPVPLRRDDIHTTLRPWSEQSSVQRWG